MKELLSALAIVMFCVLVPLQAQDKKADIKYNMDFLDKTFGIKFKSATITDKDKAIEVKITLEFTKDMEDDQKKLYEMFAPFVPGAKTSPKLFFYFFDEDNVVLIAIPYKGLEGQLTGKAGDAFRVVIELAPLKNLKKIEARPAPGSK
jgi:hypothetical protein